LMIDLNNKPGFAGFICFNKLTFSVLAVVTT
jgi:hypothetical protein